jgi:hypothetical protein
VTRYTVTRTNGREVEVVSGLLRRRAVSIVERDTAAGTRSRMDEETRVRASGRMVLR